MIMFLNSKVSTGSEFYVVILATCELRLYFCRYCCIVAVAMNQHEDTDVADTVEKLKRKYLERRKQV